MRSPSPRRAAAPSALPPRRTKRTTHQMLEDNKGPGLLVTGGRTLAGFALAAAIGAAIFFGAAAIEGDEPSPLAPWNAPSAPQVAPERLADQ